MNLNPIAIEPGNWAAVVSQIGLGGALALIIALGLAFGIATRGPEWLRSFGFCLQIILEHRRESVRIKAKIEENKNNLIGYLDKKLADSHYVIKETPGERNRS